ncbi:MAG: acyl-CoA dehydrogenase family protein, partial [Candidatus Acidiferrales bacterium]
MDFEFSDKVKALARRLQKFLDEYIYPNEQRYHEEIAKERWLKPLLAGEMRSCFAMTEPAVASSDATNIQASIVRHGNEYVINGRKWWISGVGDPRCKLAIFMGKTDAKAPAYKQQSMILVP